MKKENDMKNGLAIWHYPHRTKLENVVYFAEKGYEAVSVLGYHMDELCSNPEDSAELARLVEQYHLILTVHHKLPASHDPKDVTAYQETIDRFAQWQKTYNTLAILSFDVPQNIRDNVTQYIVYALEKVPGSRIAVEDFGLTDAERRQIESLKAEPRFGYLLDIGHMFLRIRGENTSGATLFTNHSDECEKCSEPGYNEFLKAFMSKEFPVFEIHLHNNDGVSDLHWFLEDGKLDIPMIADVLSALKWDGILTIESAPGFVFPCYGEEADTRICKTFEYWKQIRNSKNI